MDAVQLFWLPHSFADLLKYYAEMQNVFKEFEVRETMPTTQQLKDAFNLRMKDSSEEQPEGANQYDIKGGIRVPILLNVNTIGIAKSR